MKTEFNKSLNKGVPVWAPVDIRCGDLLGIVDDKDTLHKIVDTHFEKYMNYFRSLLETADVEFFQTMCVVIDEETLERRIIFSPNGFFSTLAFNLNYGNICTNFDGKVSISANGSVSEIIESFEGGFRERVDILRTVKSPDELRVKFPFIYSKYQEKVKEIQQMKQMIVKLNSMSRSQKREYIRKVDAQQRKTIPGFSLQKYLNEALTFNFSSFVGGYAVMFDSLIQHSEEVFDYIFTHPIDFNGLSGVDKNKLELYLAGQYLEMAEVTSDEKKQDYLYYVSNYFAENKDLIDSDISITIKNKKGTRFSGLIPNFEGGFVLTPRILYDRYCQLLVDNPNLRAIDFSHLDFQGMSVSEVKGFMDEYLKDLSANWEFLPPDDKSYEEDVLRKIKSSGKTMKDEDRLRRQERLLDLFMEKKELYDSSDPFFRVKGKDTFDGYIGFVYPNGRVVLDKFYDDADSGKLAGGHAVYAMSIQEFYELSRLSKSEIIRNKLCNRYVHKGNWADRVLRGEILADTGIDPTVEVKELVKKGNMALPEGTNLH